MVPLAQVFLAGLGKTMHDFWIAASLLLRCDCELSFLYEQLENRYGNLRDHVVVGAAEHDLGLSAIENAP